MLHLDQLFLFVVGHHSDYPDASLGKRQHFYTTRQLDRIVLQVHKTIRRQAAAQIFISFTRKKREIRVQVVL